MYQHIDDLVRYITHLRNNPRHPILEMLLQQAGGGDHASIIASLNKLQEWRDAVTTPQEERDYIIQQLDALRRSDDQE